MKKTINSYDDLEDIEDEELDAFWRAIEESCKDINNEFWNKECGSCNDCKKCKTCKHYSFLTGKCLKHNLFKETKDTCKDWDE
jgi:hypothetical protein